jgi:hypothetical protein
MGLEAAGRAGRSRQRFRISEKNLGKISTASDVLILEGCEGDDSRKRQIHEDEAGKLNADFF